MALSDSPGGWPLEHPARMQATPHPNRTVSPVGMNPTRQNTPNGQAYLTEIKCVDRLEWKVLRRDEIPNLISSRRD